MQFISKYIVFIIRSILRAVGGIAIWIIRTYPSIEAIDTAGHIASNVLFLKDGLHNISTNWFGGFVQNLLYPPAENIINAIITTLFNTTPLVTFQLYLSLVVIGYIYALNLVSFIFTHKKNKILYLIFVIFFLFLLKPSLVFFQGLGFVDLLFTGLTAQFLGGIGILLLIYELYNKQRIIYIIIYTTLAILSHIIMGPIAILLLSSMWYYTRQRTYGYSIGLCIGISSFFWIPFLFSMGWGTSSMILHTMPAFIFGTILVLLIAHQKSSYLYKAISITTIIILLPTISGMLFPYIKILPDFHYYRFHSIALLLRGISVLGYSDQHSISHQNNKNTRGIIILSACFFLGIHFKMTNRDYIIGLLPTTPPSEKTWNLPDTLRNGSGNNIFVIDGERAIDFHTDSMLTAYNPQASFVKGLYRESHYNNTLLSSYLATLLDEQNIVVDYIYFERLECTTYSDIMNNFISQYAIKTFLVRDIKEITYMKEHKKLCLSQFLGSGSDLYDVNLKNTHILNGKKFTLYTIDSKTTTNIGNTGDDMIFHKSNSIIQTLLPNTIFNYTSYKNNPYWPNNSLLDGLSTGDVANGSENSIHASSPEKRNIFTLYTTIEQSDKVNNILENTINIYTGEIQLINTHTNRYKITTSTNTTVLLRIKMYYYPGWHLYNQDGSAGILLPVDGGMVGYGHGEEMYLIYKKPRYIYGSYIISILSGGLLLFYLSYRKRKG